MSGLKRLTIHDSKKTTYVDLAGNKNFLRDNLFLITYH